MHESVSAIKSLFDPTHGLAWRAPSPNYYVGRDGVLVRQVRSSKLCHALQFDKKSQVRSKLRRRSRLPSKRVATEPRCHPENPLGPLERDERRMADPHRSRPAVHRGAGYLQPPALSRDRLCRRFALDQSAPFRPLTCGAFVARSRFRPSRPGRIVGPFEPTDAMRLKAVRFPDALDSA